MHRVTKNCSQRFHFKGIISFIWYCFFLAFLVPRLFVDTFAGIQLRKVEEHRQKKEQKQSTKGRFDVQTIMEAAFEMRRKALEENDSDEEDDDEADGNWSDEC